MTRDTTFVIVLLAALGMVATFVTDGAAQEAPGAEVAEASELVGSLDESFDDGAVTKQPETFLEFAVAGGYLMIPLTLCSVLWLSFLAERLLFLRKKRVMPQKLCVGFRAISKEVPLDRGKATELLGVHPSSLAVVMKVALDHLDQGREEIERSVNSAAQREIYLLRKNVRIFAVIASVAPLMGLLGTVLGLVQAFREVAISGLGSSGAALAPGIYQALITTVAGLVVAIPCLLTYYWLMARIDHYVHEMDNLVEDFVDAQGSAPPEAA
jgi:biopolymer transport protein ExbB